MVQTMVQTAYSATALQRVANFTNIQENDGKFTAVAKFASGLPLKVSVAVFATLEFVVRTALLIAASPLYFLANKTFTQMTEKTKSSAKTILRAIAALGTIRAEKSQPAPKTIRDHLNTALAAVQNNLGVTAAVIAGSLTMIALYYNYPTILSYFQEAPPATCEVPTVSKWNKSGINPVCALDKFSFENCLDPIDTPKLASIDTPKLASIDTPKLASIDTPKLASIDTSNIDTPKLASSATVLSS